MHRDGKFAAYDTNRRAVWESRSGGHPGAWLSLRNDGNLVVNQADGSGIHWQSNTALDLSDPPKELLRRIVYWKSEGKAPYDAYGPVQGIYRASWIYDTLDHEIDFESTSVTSSEQQQLDTVTLTNCTEVAIPRTWADNKTTQDSLTVTNTVTYNFGARFTFKVPWLGNTDFNFGYSTATASNQMHSVSRNRTLSEVVTVPPSSAIVGKWILYNNKYSTKFTSTTVPVNARIQARLWVPNAFSPWTNQVLDYEYSVNDYLNLKERTFYGSGYFNGVIGTDIDISETQSPADCS